MDRTGWLCERCKAKGRVRVANVVDHIQPLAKGGLDVDENTRNLCNDCHYKVGGEQFGYRVKRQISVDGWPVED